MAKTAFSQWDTVAANNTDINNIPLSDSMVADELDDAIRELMAQLASAGLISQQEFSDADWRAVATGDQSKKIKFDLSGLTTATTRTLTAPDASGTIMLTDADLTDLIARWIAASAAGPASLDIAEDTDNGTNRVRLTVPSSLSSDYTFTLPAANVTMSTFGGSLVDDADAAAVIATMGGEWAFLPVGVPIPIFDNITGTSLPPTDKAYRYIVLTAGLTGGGQYNEGVVDGESVSGSAPLVLATGVINDPGNPLDNQTVQMINTAERVLYGSSTAGTVFNDQMQQITGDYTARGAVGSSPVLSPGGAFSGTAGAATGSGFDGGAVGSGASRSAVDFNSANSSGARTGTSTRAKGATVTWVMRIH